MQVIAVSAACIGLIILCGAGLSHLPGELRSYSFKLDFSYRYMAAAFVVLIGYDLGLYANEKDSGHFRASGAMIAAVIGGALILALWGLSAMVVVAPQRLESSTVPYMTAARKALGEPGRHIMGMVAIAAAFSAINAMMHSISLMVGQLVNFYKDRGSPGQSTIFRPATVLLITGASATVMAVGVAGEPYLETWIRAGIALWMAYYIVVNVLAVRASRHRPAAAPHKPISAQLTLKMFSIGVLALAVAGIIFIEPEPLRFLTFAAVVVAMLAVVVYVFDMILNRRQR
jgi:L-asparagine transporter-like permease